MTCIINSTQKHTLLCYTVFCSTQWICCSLLYSKEGRQNFQPMNNEFETKNFFLRLHFNHVSFCHNRWGAYCNGKWRTVFLRTCVVVIISPLQSLIVRNTKRLIAKSVQTRFCKSKTWFCKSKTRFCKSKTSFCKSKENRSCGIPARSLWQWADDADLSKFGMDQNKHLRLISCICIPIIYNGTRKPPLWL